LISLHEALQCSTIFYPKPEKQMARIFTIFFEHEGSTYNALVGVREVHLHKQYELSILDEPLNQQLPSKKLYVNEAGQLAFMHSHQQPVTSLMKTIIGAVKEHLQLVSL
jgi:hypothetical protein